MARLNLNGLYLLLCKINVFITIELKRLPQIELRATKANKILIENSRTALYNEVFDYKIRLSIGVSICRTDSLFV